MATDSSEPPAEPQTTPRAGKGKARLTYAQRALILALRRDNPDLSAAVIAQTARCSLRHVYRILDAQTVDLKRLTADLMATAISERLDNWAESARTAARKGYHQPSKDWLIAAHAIDPDKPVTTAIQTGISVTLAFPLPGVPTALTPAQNAATDTPTNTPQINTAPLPDIPSAALDRGQVEPGAGVTLPHRLLPD